MIYPSTILIADISGFTDFVSGTALEHSAHIVNELLEVIVEADELGLTVSEIEGDAVLFYKKGDPIPCNDLVNQCLSSFRKFHQQVKLIERDTVCRCGACTGVTGLGLKFIAHSGPIKEIKVATFTKASGLDMIIAHRLLKNELPEDEYIIVTDRYLDPLDEQLACDLSWSSSTLAYPDVGAVGVQYALLRDIRSSLPDPPLRDRPVLPSGDDTIELEIDAPIVKVYSMVIDIDRKLEWVVGLDQINNEAPTARVGQRHTCFLGGAAIDFELIKGEFTGNAAVYAETASFQGMPYRHLQTYTLEKTADDRTGLRFEVKWGDESPPPAEMKQQFMAGIAASFENLRDLIEQSN
jgi:uncharacterized protein YndB with AHSA1/START domain